MQRREFLAQSGWLAGAIMLSRIPGVLGNSTSTKIDSNQQATSSALFETSDSWFSSARLQHARC